MKGHEEEVCCESLIYAHRVYVLRYAYLEENLQSPIFSNSIEYRAFVCSILSRHLYSIVDSTLALCWQGTIKYNL